MTSPQLSLQEAVNEAQYALRGIPVKMSRINKIYQNLYQTMLDAQSAERTPHFELLYQWELIQQNATHHCITNGVDNPIFITVLS